MLRPRQRRAFTLLEVILAITLSVVLLVALYLTLSMHYRHAQSGRDVINETVILRSVATRLAQDIASQLSATDPRLISTQATVSPTQDMTSSTTTTATTATSTTSSTTTNTSSTNTNSTPDNSSSSSAPTPSGTDNAVNFNIGVYGDAANLVLTGRSVPRDLTQPPQSQPTLTCDLRRISYWVADGRGLCRYESEQVSGTEASSPPALPPSVDNIDRYVIAPEVKRIQLEYHDGSDWQASWDGTATDASSGRPKGPPMAIAVTLTLNLAAQGNQQGSREVTYRHVVAIPTANNFRRASSSSSTSTSP